MATYEQTEVLYPDHDVTVATSVLPAAAPAPSSNGCPNQQAATPVPYTVYNLNQNIRTCPDVSNDYYVYEPVGSNEQQGSGGHANICLEEILKQNQEVWCAYKSGRFEVQTYFDNPPCQSKKVILKEKPNPCGNPCDSDYTVRRYRVQITHHKNKNDHLLLVSFQQQQQCGQFVTLQTSATSTSLVTLQNSASHAAAPLHFTLSNSNTQTQCHQQQQQDQPLTGPGIDLIAQIVEGDDEQPPCGQPQPANPCQQAQPQPQVQTTYVHLAPAAQPAPCQQQAQPAPAPCQQAAPANPCQQQQLPQASCFQSRRPNEDQDSFDEAVIDEFAPPKPCYQAPPPPPPCQQAQPAPCQQQQSQSYLPARSYSQSNYANLSTSRSNTNNTRNNTTSNAYAGLSSQSASAAAAHQPDNNSHLYASVQKALSQFNLNNQQ